MRKLMIFAAILMGAFGAGVGVVRAALTFGSGTYVNLCGSGTAATVYTCNQGCNPATGRCEGNNEGVVKWTCSGRWNQCLEAESEWANSQELGNVSCGRTVQISLFDKKCRMADGTWDTSCQLLGYMVWYSGDCGTSGGNPTPTAQLNPTNTPRVSPSPTTTPTGTPRPTATPRPTQTVSPSPSPASKFNTSPSPTPRRTSPTPTAAAVCNKRCTEGDDCGAGFACEAGVCRNPACPADRTCFCGQVKGASGSGSTPETGAEEWLLVGGVVLAISGGVMMRRAAARIW